jgi:UDP-glucose 4-epimerase
MQDIAAVIHLAAFLHIINPLSTLREKYDRINRGGTATVVNASIQASVRRVVFFSTIAVYGASAGRVLTEDTPPKPDTFYSETKLAAEQLVLNAKRSDGKPFGTVLRLGAVYGSRVKGNYRRLLLALAQRRFVPIGSGHNRRTLVYTRDVARAAVLAIQHPQAAGRVYNVSDGQFHSMNEIIAAMSLALERTPPRFSLPAGPIRVAAGLIEDVARLVGRQLPIGRATIDKYTEDVAVSSHRIQTEIGFAPQYDLVSGWQETVREMKRAGDL